MTRKKAIEAACDEAIAKFDGRYSTPYAAANAAYDAGRIAGLREAARILVASKHPVQIMAGLVIRDHARALAKPKKRKKARGK